MSDTSGYESLSPPAHLAKTLALVRQEFEKEWPRGDKQFPAGPLEGRTAEQARAEREAWWRERAEAEELLWKFAVQAPLMDMADLAVVSNKFIAAIDKHALATMKALMESRPPDDLTP